MTDNTENQEPESNVEPSTDQPGDSASPTDKETTPHQSEPDVSEILERLPTESRQNFLDIFVASMQTLRPEPNPVLEKIQPEHITASIALRSQRIKATADDRKHSRLF